MTDPVQVYVDAGALFRATAEMVGRVARQAVSRRGRFLLSLSSDSLPQALLQTLAGRPWREDIPWTSTHVVWSDECWRGAHTTARGRQQAQSLLESVPIHPENVHAVRPEASAESAACTYGDTLMSLTSEAPIDLAILGMAADGGVLSVKGGEQPPEGGQTYAVVAGAADLRIALSAQELGRAEYAVLLVLGAEAGASLAAVRCGNPVLAAARLLAACPAMTVRTDAAAAAAARQAAVSGPPDERAAAAAKERAGRLAAQRVASGMIVGLGTGSTAEWFIRGLGERLRSGQIANVTGVPTSRASARLAEAEGIPIGSLADHPAPDLVVDGADEISPHLDLIKGLGGALVREKIVARSASRVVVVADPSKLTHRLGAHGPLPIAVVRFGWESNLAALRALGAEPSLRLDHAGAPYVTDDGLVVIDARFAGGIDDPIALEQALESRPGVAATGLFLGIAESALIGDEHGVWDYQR